MNSAPIRAIDESAIDAFLSDSHAASGYAGPLRFNGADWRSEREANETIGPAWAN